MLALGFLGTVWGISRALFGSFGVLGAVSPDELQAGLGAFVGALGTALDTSVLGLVTGLSITVASAALRWFETGTLEELDRLVAQALVIDAVSADRPQPLDGLQSELTRIGAGLVEETQRALGAVVASCAQQYEATLQAVVDAKRRASTLTPSACWNTPVGSWPSSSPGRCRRSSARASSCAAPS